MRKEIKKIGNSIGIIFNIEEAKLYGLKVGDVVDLSDMTKVEIRGKKKAVEGFFDKMGDDVIYLRK